MCNYTATEGHMLFSSVSQRRFNEASVCVLSRCLEHETLKQTPGHLIGRTACFHFRVTRTAMMTFPFISSETQHLLRQKDLELERTL